MDNKVYTYFLGETTPKGFKTNFDKEICADDFYTYILKGGPGTGKSSLLKNVALNFCDVDNIDLYHCSGDPTCLDAIVLKKAKVIIVDGTAPHIFDASYPGAFQSIINLGDCWEKKILINNKTKIKQSTDECIIWQSRYKRYISALASLNSDIYSIAKLGILNEKLNGFIERFSKKYIPKNSSSNGNLSFKKISSLTKDGYSTLNIDNYSDVILLNDPYFACSDYFLQEITQICIERGYSVIVSECSLFLESTFEHLLIPELNLAFISTNFINDIKSNEINKINFLRFYDKDKIQGKKNRLDFSKKAALELKDEAVYSLRNAKKVHDHLETFYIEAMDFSKINHITSNLIEEISLKY